MLKIFTIFLNWDMMEAFSKGVRKNNFEEMWSFPSTWDRTRNMSNRSKSVLGKRSKKDNKDLLPMEREEDKVTPHQERTSLEPSTKEREPITEEPRVTSVELDDAKNTTPPALVYQNIMNIIEEAKQPDEFRKANEVEDTVY